MADSSFSFKICFALSIVVMLLITDVKLEKKSDPQFSKLVVMGIGIGFLLVFLFL